MGKTGKEHPRWTGGRWVTKAGYVTIWTAPYTSRLEHRVVAEAMLGRRLALGEIVHHKNGDRADNRPENLEVMTRGQHAKVHSEQGDLLRESPGAPGCHPGRKYKARGMCLQCYNKVAHKEWREKYPERYAAKRKADNERAREKYHAAKLASA